MKVAAAASWSSRLQIHNGEASQGVRGSRSARRVRSTRASCSPTASPVRRDLEQLHFFNPNAEEAAVRSTSCSIPAKRSPLSCACRPATGSPSTCRVSLGSRKDVGHALIVRVSNNVPIAVARTIDVGTPGARTAYIIDIGATSAAKHWGFASGGSSPAQEEFIAVINEADHSVTVNVTTPDGSQLRRRCRTSRR